MMDEQDFNHKMIVDKKGKVWYVGDYKLHKMKRLFLYSLLSMVPFTIFFIYAAVVSLFPKLTNGESLFDYIIIILPLEGLVILYFLSRFWQIRRAKTIDELIKRPKSKGAYVD